MRRPRPVLLATAIALAAAAPAGAAEVQVNGLDSPLVWAPATVDVQPGDTVVWKWGAFPSPPHNVVSTSANWTYRSVDGETGAAFTFAAPGSYTYFCQVHGAGMSGVVSVGNPPPPPPPPLSEQPFPNDGGMPAVLETGGLDQARPSLGRIRVRRAGAAAQLRFRVSEPSEVTLRFQRDGRTVATRRVQAAGTVRLSLRASRSLRAGRYRVLLRARDGAGNASRLRSARLTVG